MRRYWIIAPHGASNPTVYDAAWKYAQEHGRISIGWADLGDVAGLSETALKARVLQTLGEKSGMVYSYFRRFYHDISEGDIVIAKRGRSRIVGVGTVTRTAFYEKTSGKEAVGNAPRNDQPNFLGVDWQRPGLGQERVFAANVLAIATLYEISEAKFHEFLNNVPTETPSSPPSEMEVENESEFVLEKYLQEFIVSNFKAIFGKEGWMVYKDPEGTSGALYTTGAGEIDILAESPDGFVVIELKKGRASDVVVGQILRYMGWVKQNLCVNDQDVSGLIISKEYDAKLEYALMMVPSVGVKLYSLSFALKDTSS